MHDMGQAIHEQVHSFMNMQMSRRVIFQSQAPSVADKYIYAYDG